MKIELMYFLNKKNIKLEYFCRINNLKTYNSLSEYCHKCNFIPVEESFYLEQIPPIIVVEDKAKKKETSEAILS